MSAIDRTAIRHAVRLTRIDLVRTIRKQTDRDGGASSMLGAVVYVVVLVAGTAGGAYLGYRAGTVLADGTLAGSGSPIESVRGIITFYWLVSTFVFLVRAIGQRGTLAEPEGILTVVPTREAFAAVLVGEYVFGLLWLLLPGTGIGVGLAIGSGTVVPVLTIPLTILTALATSVGIGFTVGLAIRHAATRFPTVVRHKSGVIVLAFLAYFFVLTSSAFNDVLGTFFDPLVHSPLGWYADLAAIGLPTVESQPIQAAGVFAVAAIVVPTSLVAGTALAERHWFSDPALAGEPEPSADRAGDAAATAVRPAGRGMEHRLVPFVGRPSASLVATTWRRSIRSPMKLLYAFYPLLFGAGFIAEILRTGDVPALLPYLVLLFAAWAAGVIFTLNPLGDQGAVLSATLLSGVEGREFVGAHLLAGLLVAIPIGTVATVAVALLSPLEPQRVALLAVAAPVAMFVAATLSVGIGTAFPRFEATNVTRSIETVIPSRWAFVLFTLHLFVTAAASAVVLEPVAAGFGAAILTFLLPLGLSVSETGLVWTARIALVPLLLAPIPALRYAIGRFDRYALT